MAVVIGAGAVGAFMQRESIGRWWAVRSFMQPGDRASQVTALSAYGEPVVPSLLATWKGTDGDLISASADVLSQMIKEWGRDDERTARLRTQLVTGYDQWSEPGCTVALRCLDESGIGTDAGTDAGTISGCRRIAAHALQSPVVDQRIYGIRFALKPELGLLPQVVPLLKDSSPEVRRAAMVTVGPRLEGEEAIPEVIAAEDLLAWLHDEDAEVRRLCERSLRTRGLREDEIRLGRRLTHPDAQERLGLLIDLSRAEDVDLPMWLERLSRDSSSAVRAATARVASERQVPIDDRLDEMSRTDPDSAVRTIAEYYRKLNGR